MKKYLNLLFVASIVVTNSFAQHVNDYQLYHNEGRQLARSGMFTEAIDAYDKAISIMPYYSEIYFDRGDAKMEIKNYRGAAQDYTKVLHQAPHKHEALFFRAKAYIEMQNFEPALDDLDELLVLNPQDTEAATLRNQASAALTAQQQNVNQSAEAFIDFQSRNTRRQQFQWQDAVPLVLLTAAILHWW